MDYFRYFIELAYNGSRYHGWQVQPNAMTVQEMITRAARLMWMNDFTITGCGRTDTGVHASQYYAHFDLKEARHQQELDDLAFKLNRYLPADIAIYRIFQVPPELHARFDPLSRTYEYHIHTRKDPFLDDHSWFFHQFLDVDIMNKGGNIIAEYEDFTSFSKANVKRKTNLCTVTEAYWRQEGHRLIFTITANRFLHDMVRAIVGTLIKLGQHRISLEELRKIIESKDRCQAGESVPAHGLFLSRIIYPGIEERP